MVLRLGVAALVVAGTYVGTGSPLLPSIALGVAAFAVLTVLAKMHDPGFQADLQAKLDGSTSRPRPSDRRADDDRSTLD